MNDFFSFFFFKYVRSYSILHQVEPIPEYFRHMSQTNSRCSHHISVCTKPVQHTPFFALYHSLPRDTNLTCFTLRQKAFVAKFLFTYLILFAIGKLFFFFDQSFPLVKFNYLFSFFAAHKIHGMDDRGVCVCDYYVLYYIY